MAIVEATKEALWLRGLVEEFGVKQEVVPVFSDSQSAIYLKKNLRFHERTKHIDVRIHFMKDIISSGKVKVLKIHLKDNSIDMITKVVTIIKFKKCLSLIRVMDYSHKQLLRSASAKS